MTISLNGFNEQVATFEAEPGVAAGIPVKMTGNGVVGVCADKDSFCGVALSERDGFAAVQLKGYVQLPYTGTAEPSVGYQTLSAAAVGKIQADPAGRSCLVTDVDSTAKLCGIIL
jgi:hypothetical protein